MPGNLYITLWDDAEQIRKTGEDFYCEAYSWVLQPNGARLDTWDAWTPGIHTLWVTSTKHAQWDRISSASRCLFTCNKRWGVFPDALPGVSQYDLIQIHQRALLPSTTHHLWLFCLPRGGVTIRQYKLSFERLRGLFAAGCPLSKAPFTQESATALNPCCIRCVPRAPLCKQLDNTAIAPADSDIPVIVPITISARSYPTLALADDCFDTCCL